MGSWLITPTGSKHFGHHSYSLTCVFLGCVCMCFIFNNFKIDFGKVAYMLALIPSYHEAV